MDDLSMELLEQIANCDSSAEQFADYIEQQALIRAPHDFSESVLKRSRQLDIQASRVSSQVSKRLQFFYYSLRVSGAVLAALMILVTLPTVFRNRAPAYPSAPSYLQEKAEQLNNHFDSFSDKLLNLGVSDHD
ncbi:MAG: hypothetical protein ACLTKI_01960 [Lachnospiraceae bacterium]